MPKRLDLVNDLTAYDHPGYLADGQYTNPNIY